MIEGWIQLNVLMPILHPRLWLAHRRACQQLLDDLGYDLDLDLDLNL
jgi:hypothetical protein